jgi:hypothetical protein
MKKKDILLPSVCPYVCIFKTTQGILMRFLIDKVIQEGVLFVFNMQNIRKRNTRTKLGGSLVKFKLGLKT